MKGYPYPLPFDSTSPDAHVGQQVAELQSRANRDDAIKEAVIEEQNEAIANNADRDGFAFDSYSPQAEKQEGSSAVAPTVEGEPNPKCECESVT